MENILTVLLNQWQVVVILLLLFIILFLVIRNISNIELIESDMNQLVIKNAMLEVKIEEQNRYNEEKSILMQSHKDELKDEFERLASRVLDSNSQKFSSLSTQNMDRLISPLNQQILEFKQQIADVYNKDSQDRAILKHEIYTLKTLNQKISQDAINLTNALKSENKKQGIWGEMVLKKVLEASGLREGYEFEQEVTCHNEENKLLRPDVIVRLPDKRDIIIDSKTSLVAYERYVNTNEEEDKSNYLKAHLESVKRHIDTLSEKNYERLKEVNTLDFIFMFMPIEGALATALEHDSEIYNHAFNKKILLVGPTTLLVAMRAVESVWRDEKQYQNAKEIARRAGAMYDKFVIFSDDMVKLSKQFDVIQQSFLLAKNRLSDGKGNLVRQAQQLKELGAQTNKEISKEL